MKWIKVEYIPSNIRLVALLAKLSTTSPVLIRMTAMFKIISCTEVEIRLTLYLSTDNASKSLNYDRMVEVDYPTNYLLHKNIDLISSNHRAPAQPLDNTSFCLKQNRMNPFTTMWPTGRPPYILEPINGS